jgi:ankyrin repeat protein
MDQNVDTKLMLDLNQKVKELIVMENIPILQELFQKYNILFQPIDANNLTSLHFAVQMNRKRSILFLCKLMSQNCCNISNEEENKGINSQDILGRTPLHQASAKGDLETIDCLIKFGANVNAKTISGETPLMKAIAFYQTEAATLLLRFGADPDMKNNVTGKNCLNQAYESKNDDLIPVIKQFSEKYSEIIKMILKIGNKNYPRKNYLQKIPDYLLRKTINYLIP